MNKVFLVEWSVIFEMSDIMHFKDLVWANSEEEAKEKLLSEKKEKAHSVDGVVSTVKVKECKPENGIFHLGSF